MSSRVSGPRPPILTLIGWVSLIWSATSLVGVFVAIFFIVVLGAGSWLGGPAAGAIGSALGLLVIGLLMLGSCLSLYLLSAGWRTLADDPSGIDRHRTWAGISIVFDVVALLISGGIWGSSWWGLVYACFVLYVTGWPEVQAYRQGVSPWQLGAKPPAWNDEAF